MHAPPASRPLPAAAASAARPQQEQQLTQRGIRLYDAPLPPPQRPRAATHGVGTRTASRTSSTPAHAAAVPPPALQNDGEVYFTSARVVDSRISYVEGRRFVEYKLAIETATRGTLFAWHRYSVFLQLASTLQLRDSDGDDGELREMLPRLPSKKLFGNFSDATISARVEKLNWFLAAAVGVEFLEWGIRLDDGTCVYKRNKSSSGRDSLVSNASTATTSSSSPRRRRLSRRLSLKSFGFRRASAAE